MYVLSVDLEDWFHQIGIPAVQNPYTWLSFDSRVEKNTYRLLDMFDEAGVKATFFTLGWIAKIYPGLVREIAKRGHEFGCHSHLHRPIHELSELVFREDLRMALGNLEEIISQKVRYFRAPGFSLTKACLWAIPILAAEGITCDASFFSGAHAHGGFPDLDFQAPFRMVHDGVELLEFPATTFQLGPLTMAPSGGGYFRLLPYSIIRRLIDSRRYVMSYIHPRDLDPDQPTLNGLTPWRKFKANVGLHSGQLKLASLIRDYKWVSVGACISELSPSNCPIISL